MRVILWSVFLLFVCQAVFSQNETSHWFINSNRVKINKSGITNVPFNNEFWPPYTVSTSLSDKDGNLLFLSNGYNIYNKNLSLMQGVTDELHAVGTTMLTAPFPGNPSKHYLFYTPYDESRSDLKYAVIDMSANGGLGKVESINNIVDSGLSKGFTLNVIRNSEEFWIVAHRYKTDSFHVRKVTSSGIGAPVKSRAGSNSYEADYRFDELKTSRDGKLIAGYSYADYTVIFATVYSFVEVFNFNSSTGTLTSKVRSKRNFGYFGRSSSIEFSPDSRLLYLMSMTNSYGLQPCDFGASAVYQFNLCYTDSTTFTDNAMILATNFTWCYVAYWGRLQLGADRKIHMPYYWDRVLSAINFPNRIGSSSFTEFGAHSMMNQTASPMNTTFNHYYVAKAVINNIQYSAGCFPDPVKFSISNDTIASAKWNFGDPASGSNTSNQLTPQHVYSSPGIYTVTAEIYTAGGSLIEKLEEKVEIKDPAKRLLYQFPKDTAFCDGGKFRLKLNVINGIFKWYRKIPDTDITYKIDVADSIDVYESGTYYVEMIQNDCDGCVMRDSIKVNVIPKPYTFLGTETKLCGTDSLQLNVYDEGADYLWSTGSADTKIWVKQPGIYWVEGEFNNSGCVRRDSIKITAAPGINYDLPADTTLCANQTLSLQTNLYNAFLIWNNESYGPAFIVEKPGTITLRIMDNNSCIKDDTMNVSYSVPPDIFIGNDTTLCQGGSLRLNATSTAGNFKWNTGATTSFIDVNSSGLYYAEVTDGNCNARDSIKVQFAETQKPSLGADKYICDNETATLSAGLPNGNFKWSTGSTNQSIQTSVGGEYSVIAEVNGCTNADTINVFVKPNPVVHIGRDTSLCQGDFIIADAGNPGATYRWQDNSIQRSLKITNTGNYSVQVNLNGCVKSDDIAVVFNEGPSFNLGNDKEICPDQTIALSAGIQGSDYKWQDGSTQSSFTVSEPGIYSLTATNKCGSFTDEVIITRGLCKLAMPNAFTPNSDGKNDVLRISNASQIKSFSLNIFNRWGQLIFTTTDPYKGWDGKFNSVLQPEGNYMWSISLVDNEGNKVQAKGQVLLIR